MTTDAMGIKGEYITRAKELKQNELKKRRIAYEQALAALTDQTPRLAEIDRRLGEIGSSLVLLAISGKTKELEKAQEESEALSAEKKALLAGNHVTEPTVLCPLCHDTGYKDGHICPCINEIAKGLMYTDLAERFPLKESTFRRFNLSYYPESCQKKMSHILHFCEDYAAHLSENCGNLLFTGKSGLGKTHLSLAIAGEAINKGLSVVYGSAQNLFASAEKEHFSYSGETAKTDELLTCDLLILDDLGAEFTNAYTQSLFYNIVNSRLLAKKGTIINTNLDFDELTDRYTARITSRLIGSYALKQFDGCDIRQLIALEKKKNKSNTTV